MHQVLIVAPALLHVELEFAFLTVSHPLFGFVALAARGSRARQDVGLLRVAVDAVAVYSGHGEFAEVRALTGFRRARCKQKKRIVVVRDLFMFGIVVRSWGWIVNDRLIKV